MIECVSPDLLTMNRVCFLVYALALTVPRLFISGVISSATFTIVNKCEHTVWPGILSNAGIAPLSITGFALQKGESKTIAAPSSWGGRLWGRTHCTEDSTGKFSCVTGDCGSGKVECAGGNAEPPATLAEFTLDGSGGLDFYDLSLVDGYNLPVMIVPQGGAGENCTKTECIVDLNGSCPSTLRVRGGDGQSVACKSACSAFGEDQYCCSGSYDSPNTCKPSSYSRIFKSACPQAYSYAYDDRTSTFTCAGADYLITFCPAPSTSQKSSSDGQTPTQSESDNSESRGMNSTMVYEGVLEISGASSPYTCTNKIRTSFLARVVAIMAAIWWPCRLL